VRYVHFESHLGLLGLPGNCFVGYFVVGFESVALKCLDVIGQMSICLVGSSGASEVREVCVSCVIRGIGIGNWYRVEFG
jgi:hypothetical protein